MCRAHTINIASKRALVTTEYTMGHSSDKKEQTIKNKKDRQQVSLKEKTRGNELDTERRSNIQC
jgi:hypothetical protein